MQNFHLIEARYVGPTEHRGSRVILTSSRFSQFKTIAYDYSFNNAKDIAIDWLTKEGHNVVGAGEIRGVDVIVVADSDGIFKPLKEKK